MLRKTPVTEDGLKTFDSLPADEAVLAAWMYEGNHPAWHHRMQQIVRAQMPVLARALDRLVEEGNTK
ncbi:hypothetical protein SEA_LEWANDO_58 [Arthrobacter phage Lewando]|nr:hypothetical protein SEA_LEWANDO_58 [Arthrobacter phage Lewando]